jgi:glutamate N-acetyltransferase/amino-acid N-acetyltransferase
MAINIKNLLFSKKKKSKMGDFQDLEHINGIAISAISANLYNDGRDDLVLFYFRDGAKHASVFTQSKIVSENIKWNQKIKNKLVKALLINTRNANAFTGEQGYDGIKQIAKELSKGLTLLKSKDDKGTSEAVKTSEILFGCTGTIGEVFPTEKIKDTIPYLIEKIKYVQNKYLWLKAASGIMTTDLVPKVAMEECKIGDSKIKIYGVAKGSGMIYPKMATTLGYVFTDAELPSIVLKKLLKKNIETTFNAITCDGDTSTNDMVTIFSTGKVKHLKIESHHDPKLKNFDLSLNAVLLNLAKRVVADGEGSSKFITINVMSANNENDAKRVAFSIANSSLVKTAIAGEDPNWGRIIMAIGKANISLKLDKLNIKFGELQIIEQGKLSLKYDEATAAKYMKWDHIEINVDLNLGNGNFTVYTMDFTKEYIDINADYRS